MKYQFMLYAFMSLSTLNYCSELVLSHAGSSDAHVQTEGKRVSARQLALSGLQRQSPEDDAVNARNIALKSFLPHIAPPKKPDDKKKSINLAMSIKALVISAKSIPDCHKQEIALHDEQLHLFVQDYGQQLLVDRNPIPLKINKGIGTIEDRYKQLAEQGLTLAAYNYSLLLESNEKTKDESACYYTKAAQGGHPKAMNALGVFLLRQKNIASINRAIYWLEAAGVRGNLQAARNLILCYSYLINDPDRAKTWVAREKDLVHAQTLFARSRQALRDGENRSAAWLITQASDLQLPRAIAHQGNAEYRIALTKLQDSKISSAREAQGHFEQAEKLLRKSASFDDQVGHYSLATLLRDRSLKENEDKGEILEHYEQAAVLGHRDAIYHLITFASKHNYSDRLFALLDWHEIVS